MAIMSKVVDPEVSAAARRLNALARKGTPAQKAAWRENMKGGGRPRVIEGVWVAEMRRIADRLRACTTPKDYYDWLKGLPEPHPQAKPDVNLTASWRAQRAARWRARQLVDRLALAGPFVSRAMLLQRGREELAEAIAAEPCPDWRKPRATVTR